LFPLKLRATDQPVSRERAIRRRAGFHETREVRNERYTRRVDAPDRRHGLWPTFSSTVMMTRWIDTTHLIDGSGAESSRIGLVWLVQLSPSAVPLLGELTLLTVMSGGSRARSEDRSRPTLPTGARRDHCKQPVLRSHGFSSRNNHCDPRRLGGASDTITRTRSHSLSKPKNAR
jgi:hypothetical protein